MFSFRRREDYFSGVATGLPPGSGIASVVFPSACHPAKEKDRTLKGIEYGSSGFAFLFFFFFRHSGEIKHNER